jgi:ATP synthase protein I
MTTGYFADSRRSAFRVVGAQFLVALAAGAVAALVAGAAAGYAALIGGLIGSLSNMVLVLRAFGRTRRDPGQFLRGLAAGEAVKFAVTVALFVIAIVVLKAAFLPLMLAYIATFLVYWIALLKNGFGQAT